MELANFSRAGKQNGVSGNKVIGSESGHGSLVISVFSYNPGPKTSPTANIYVTNDLVCSYIRMKFVIRRH
jgi:hypothetical protein